MGKRWLETGNATAFMKEAARISARIDQEVFRTGLDAARDADAIVGGTFAEEMRVHAGRAPARFRLPLPTPFRSKRRGTMLSRSSRSESCRFRVLNRATFALFPGSRVTAACDDHGDLPQGTGPSATARDSRVASCGARCRGASALEPAPRPHASDAAPKAVTTGFLRLPQAVRGRLGEKAPPDDLLSWLEAGPPPVYVGFGSMPMPSLVQFAEDLLDIGRSLGVRFRAVPWGGTSWLRIPAPGMRSGCTSWGLSIIGGDL
jgi:hypothetical protein